MSWAEVKVSRAANEREIRTVEAAYDEAWRLGDLDALIQLMTSDVVLVNPRGAAACGLAEVRRDLGGFLSGEAAGSSHHSVIERVEFVTDEVAVVDGKATVTGVGEGDDRLEIAHGFTDVLVRTGGRWLIAHVRAYLHPPF